MISRYSFGKPFETEALVVKIEATEGKLPFFRTDGEGNYYYDFDDKDIVYGLGEQIRGINKRGWTYTSWNLDNPHHHEDTHSLCVCGNDIVDIVLAAEKYSRFDTTEVRTEIEKKRVWLRDNEPEEYARAVGEDEDIFTLWKKKGYV